MSLSLPMRKRGLELLEDRRMMAVGVAPTDILLSQQTVPENSAAGILVGSLTATDADPAPTGLVLLYDPSDGSARLKNFGPEEIRTDGYQIESKAGKLDVAGWRSVQEWAAEPNGLSEAQLVLGPGENTVVTGWSEAQPTNAFLSELNVVDEALLSPAEAWPVGKPFSTFAFNDLTFKYRDVGPNGGQVKVGQVLFDYPSGVSYSLVDSAGGRFRIEGDQLQVAAGAALDYEAEPSYTVRVRATDAEGLSVERDFVISLTNANDAPVVNVPNAPLASQPGATIAVPGLAVDDPDLLGSDRDTKPLWLSLSAHHGVLQLGSLAGLTIVSGANGSAAVSLLGPLTKLNEALNTLTHQASAGFSGIATLSVSVNDLGHSGEGLPLSSEATLEINVNTAPVAVADHYEVGFGRTLRAQSYRSEVLASGPLAYWRLGDAGPDVVDSAGDFDGVVSPATVLGVPGALGADSDTAASFQDLNTRILVDDAQALSQPMGPFSVEAWVNPSQSLAWQRIASTRNGPSAGWGFALSNQRLAFTTYGIKDYFLEGTKVPENTWSHVVAVFDAQQDVSFYLNGQFVGKVEGSANPNPGGSLLAIGDNPDQSAQPWQGKLDEVAIYGKALSAGDIARHWQAAPVNATVLANDTDAEGDPLTALLVAQPQHGTLEFSADGSFVYRSNPRFYGRDTFKYRAVDAYFESEAVEVAIDVIPVAGDADFDGDVDLADFGVLKAKFGVGTTRQEGDFNGDGKVDLSDFAILKQAFGTVEPEED